eukprot:2944071-Amphidinium_carterae.2
MTAKDTVPEFGSARCDQTVVGSHWSNHIGDSHLTKPTPSMTVCCSDCEAPKWKIHTKPWLSFVIAI